jgi:hypothetical protein
VRKKTVAFLLLFVVIAGAFYVTSPLATLEFAMLPEGFFAFFEACGVPFVALADPVPGGGGGGGDN